LEQIQRASIAIPISSKSLKQRQSFSVPNNSNSASAQLKNRQSLTPKPLKPMKYRPKVQTPAIGMSSSANPRSTMGKTKTKNKKPHQTPKPRSAMKKKGQNTARKRTTSVAVKNSKNGKPSKTNKMNKFNKTNKAKNQNKKN
jgi:hypothetical protein